MHRRPPFSTLLRVDSIARVFFYMLAASLLILADGYVLVIASRSMGVFLLLAITASTGLAGVVVALSNYRSLLARARRTVRAGRYPVAEFRSICCLLVGTALLILPGFVTDAVGIAVQVPPLRWVVGGLLERLARSQLEELYEFMKLEE